MRNAYVNREWSSKKYRGSYLEPSSSIEFNTRAASLERPLTGSSHENPSFRLLSLVGYGRPVFSTGGNGGAKNHLVESDRLSWLSLTPLMVGDVGGFV